MNPLSTLPTTSEQARHALLLLGAPAPARLLVDVHAALFDGDLSVPALAALLRARPAPGPGQADGSDDRPPVFCHALNADLSAAPGLIALAEWPLSRRLVTPAHRRADTLAMILRLSEFVAAQPYAARSADRLLRTLATEVPHGPEAYDLTEAARAALTAEPLLAAMATEQPLREAAVARADSLDPTHRLYGIPTVPHQRGHH